MYYTIIACLYDILVVVVVVGSFNGALRTTVRSTQSSAIQRSSEQRWRLLCASAIHIVWHAVPTSQPQAPGTEAGEFVMLDYGVHYSMYY